MPSSYQSLRHIPSSFSKKKSKILLAISNYDSTEYNDKSPKGTIDSDIIGLIDEINAFDRYVTTSSCAGRVTVFVEGRKVGATTQSKGTHNTTGQTSPSLELGRVSEVGTSVGGEPTTAVEENKAAGPGGKGHGNRWLYVSHSPVAVSHLTSTKPLELHDLFQLSTRSALASESELRSSIMPFSYDAKQFSPRLVKLLFSPLILHVLCANLHAAKGILAAAINAGFRESGVQSLKALDDEEAGVMVGIRTAGLGFESVIGVVDEVDGQEVYRGLVDERYLRMCVGVVNERFASNVERRERLREELGLLKKQEEKQGRREDGDVRRERKRMEGLMRKMEKEENTNSRNGESQPDGADVLNQGLFLDAT